MAARPRVRPQCTRLLFAEGGVSCGPPVLGSRLWDGLATGLWVLAGAYAPALNSCAFRIAHHSARLAVCSNAVSRQRLVELVNEHVAFAEGHISGQQPSAAAYFAGLPGVPPNSAMSVTAGQLKLTDAAAVWPSDRSYSPAQSLLAGPPYLPSPSCMHHSAS